MAYRYEITASGALPLKFKEVKAYLRIDTDEDNDLLNALIRTAVQFGERYTGVDFRAITRKLTLDEFTDRICLRRNPVASITSVQYLKTTLQTVATTVYYLKKGRVFSEVLLQEDQAWPTDGDAREAGIEIVFVTAPTEFLDQAKTALLRHLAALYECRGDCDTEEVALQKGVMVLYGQFRTERV